ncbi:MAG: phosphatase [Bacteroidetes bacterium]|nr:MAG: phosphatase [Bacteroidota bacterium]
MIDEQIETMFTELGATFVAPFGAFKARLARIRAFLFDWDGVFNAGLKTASRGSSFSEPDAMGTNLMRLGFWLNNGQQLPVVGIITGAQNPTALQLAQREHYQAVYMGVKYKPEALEHLCRQWGLKPEEVAYTFDDVNDLEMAARCGLRLLVRRTASPFMLKYALDKQLVDYHSAHRGGEGAVREICELIMACWGVFEDVAALRSAYDPAYQAYLSQRNQHSTGHFSWSAKGITSMQTD